MVSHLGKRFLFHVGKGLQQTLCQTIKPACQQRQTALMQSVYEALNDLDSVAEQHFSVRSVCVHVYMCRHRHLLHTQQLRRPVSSSLFPLSQAGVLNTLLTSRGAWLSSATVAWILEPSRKIMH